MLRANPTDLKEQAKLQKFEALLSSEDNSSEETEPAKAKAEQAKAEPAKAKAEQVKAEPAKVKAEQVKAEPKKAKAEQTETPAENTEDTSEKKTE